jgi:hypothetical protein
MFLNATPAWGSFFVASLLAKEDEMKPSLRSVQLPWLYSRLRFTLLSVVWLLLFAIWLSVSGQPSKDKTNRIAAPARDAETLALTRNAELEISIASRDRLRGVIKRGRVGLRFDSRKKGDSIFLDVRSLTGRQLLFLDGRGDTVTAAIDEKRLMVTASKADILALRRSSPAGDPAASRPDATTELKSKSTTRGCYAFGSA